MKRTLTTLFAVTLCVSAFSQSLTTEEVLNRIQKSDAQIEGMQFSMKSEGASFKQPIPWLDKRLEMIQGKPLSREDKLLIVAIKTIDMMVLDGVIRCDHVQTNNRSDRALQHTTFLEPERRIGVSHSHQDSTKKHVSINTQAGIVPWASTPYRFGRGITRFPYGGLHIQPLTDTKYTCIFIQKTKERYVFTVDTTKEMCWIQYEEYASDGSLQFLMVHSDFEQVNGVWFPMTSTATRYYPNGEIQSEEHSTLVEVKPLQDIDAAKTRMDIETLISQADEVTIDGILQE